MHDNSTSTAGTSASGEDAGASGGGAGKRRFRRRHLALAAAAALTAATVATVTALSSWGTDTVAPSDVRADAAADAKGQFGAVDCREAKCIALTFDAGPGKDTPELLDTLKREKVPATFFLLGKNHVKKYPDVVKRLADEGHEVANHTWTHGILTDLSKDEIRAELDRTQQAVKDITGKEPTLMRPPQGRTDEKVTQVCKELGLSQVLWSVTAKDYSTTDSKLIERRVLDQADRDGIILLHDIYDGTVPAVPGIIKSLKAQGYTFVTVPQLMAPGVPEPGAVYRP
ncbi:polysaccharide deacetylase family protein [Streptomyces indicus]|uniref:Peptidoglycan/xylan/chitin deacetylase, PgdA/CDA1 family n=1 Tax=Streptomyces indicus TaxID=417292 RepID=A0A1G8YL79_9ACTN|nr:polysaccharide deacetylase family protein [Streptomyces indicus]SDK02820.1 Peptidoglycan/xylan/chitin deacetylase, PgdA/CDA1 family [Streptomyces indicus]